MAVFVSYSDESTGKNQLDTFIFAGWIGPEEDWSRFFVPAWDERVLAGPPRIPYFHMTEIRRPEWQKAHGISETGAYDRINEACIVLDQLANLHPLRIAIDTACVRDQFSGIRVKRARSKQFACTDFEPDYIGFLAYAWAARTIISSHLASVWPMTCLATARPPSVRALASSINAIVPPFTRFRAMRHLR